MNKWMLPKDYGGFSPDGDYILLERTRNSDCLENSNYECAFEALKSVATKFPQPDYDKDYRFGWVYDFRARHWCCGWVETLLVRADAPDEVIKAAEAIDCALADYPVFNDVDYRERLSAAAQRYWESLPMRWKIEECCEHGLSMFAARSEHPPYDMEEEF